MRFLVDESTGPAVADWLDRQGHEVLSVYEAMRGLSDEAIVERAYSENWILITNDKDFGQKVFREHKPHHGVVLIRLNDERAKIKIEVLASLLANYAGRLPEQFVVATEKSVRFAKA